MKKVIGIIAGDPNSINSEIIAKAWFKKNNFKKLNIFIIGSLFLLEKQISKIGYNIRLKKIDKFSNHNFKKNLYVYDVPLKFKDPFNISIKNKTHYIKESFRIASKLINEK